MQDNGKNEFAQKVIVAIMAVLLTFLATLAYSGVTGITRAEVDRAIKDSETRTVNQIVDLKHQQDQILEKLEGISQEQVRLSTKLDLTLHADRNQR